MRLGEEIAVLDGLDLGAVAPRGVLPPRMDVVDPSGGANYTGGSDFSPGFPLLPSSSGLSAADADIVVQAKMLQQKQLPPGVLPPRRNVIDPNSGQYTGGNAYSPFVPMLPSSAGLAQFSATGSGSSIRADVLPPRVNVIDPSGGALYTGGSDFSPGFPLLPSSSGLAAFEVAPNIVQISTREFQQLMVAAGANTPVSGVWGARSLKDIIAFAQKEEGGRVTAADVAKQVKAYAGGEMLLVKKRLVERLTAMATTGFAGLGAAMSNAVLPPRTNVVDPNGGQYTGGNAYSPFVPMLPSSAGLASLDAVPDSTFTRGMKKSSTKSQFKRGASSTALAKLQQSLRNMQASYAAMTPEQKYVARHRMQELRDQIARTRGVRYDLLVASLRSQPKMHAPPALR